jgi:hypothetical protein
VFPLNCILAGTNTFHPDLAVRSRHLILVVENELLLSVDISDALKDEDYDVIAVSNADEAIKALETCECSLRCPLRAKSGHGAVLSAGLNLQL